MNKNKILFSLTFKIIKTKCKLNKKTKNRFKSNQNNIIFNKNQLNKKIVKS